MSLGIDSSSRLRVINRKTERTVHFALFTRRGSCTVLPRDFPAWNYSTHALLLSALIVISVAPFCGHAGSVARATSQGGGMRRLLRSFDDVPARRANPYSQG